MEILSCDLPGIPKVRSGKVREIFDLGDSLLFVATDRISAFDCIMPNPIPGKGAVLTGLSAFWFRQLDFVENHVLAARFEDFPEALQAFSRAARGALNDREKGAAAACRVRGARLPRRLRLEGLRGIRDHLRRADPARPAPGGGASATMFTPSTKAESGHDDEHPLG